jgi:hypothetical protein
MNKSIFVKFNQGILSKSCCFIRNSNRPMFSKKGKEDYDVKLEQCWERLRVALESEAMMYVEIARTGYVIYESEEL